MEYKITTRSEMETIEIAQNFESEKFPNMIILKILKNIFIRPIIIGIIRVLIKHIMKYWI